MNEAVARSRSRCAIYTRKSTEEGLDQAFNSLDAQREACEAYIKSQVGEGWTALPDSYDDGGFSGGNMVRPAMQRLLADIDAGKVDVIVVYKVDRLTRSLMDFARIVERLDARGVSFVSVTQAFNTTSSMGRLTLNVLLSFAQFEREVTGERIRDKVAASKAKGMWMGGNVPLGYDLLERKLIINEAEAGQVRHIFNRYVEVRSAVALMEELQAEGIVSKRWTARSGREMGGTQFRCGALYYVLQNRLYVGEIVHRGKRHKGEHEAIVSGELFTAVEAILALNRQQKSDRPTRTASCPLAGRVFDGGGTPMSPTFSYGRGGKLYRYYVSASLLPGSGSTQEAKRGARRVPAAPLERLVRERLAQLLAVPEPLSWATVLGILERVELRDRSIQLILRASSFLEPHEPLERGLSRLGMLIPNGRIIAEGEGAFRLICDRGSQFRGGKSAGTGQVPSGSHINTEPLQKLKVAHKLLNTHSTSPLTPERHGLATAPPYQRERRLIALGLLSPKLQRQIAEGGITAAALDHAWALPLAWADQDGTLCSWPRRSPEFLADVFQAGAKASKGQAGIRRQAPDQ